MNTDFSGIVKIYRPVETNDTLGPECLYECLHQPSFLEPSLGLHLGFKSVPWVANTGVGDPIQYTHYITNKSSFNKTPLAKFT